MTTLQDTAQKQLREYIDQIERLEEDKAALHEDIKDKYGEAKSLGFDSKILRKVIRLRKQSADARREEDAILDVYLHALGMLEEDK